MFLRHGMAFVPRREISSIVLQEFQTRLEKALEVRRLDLQRVEARFTSVLSDDRESTTPTGRRHPDHSHPGQPLAGFPGGCILGMGKRLVFGGRERGHSGHGRRHCAEALPCVHAKSARLSAEGPTSQAFWSSAVRSFLEGAHLVVSILRSIRRSYHRRYQVLGLSIDEAILFWRKSFSNIQDDKFNKEYRYNIRHSFGLEGKRANYAAKRYVRCLVPTSLAFRLTVALSCQQILLADQPGTSDNHGCPYRHFAPENLQTALLSMYSSQGLTSADLPEIMHTVKNGHYHVACTRVFEITHSRQVLKGEGIGGGESVTHPNQYVTKSRELEVKTQVKDEDVVMG